MKTEETIWVVSQPDLWGYGLTATGHTANEAKRAFWKSYKRISANRQPDNKPVFKNMTDLNDWWGIHEREYEIGQAYFGDEGAAEHRRREQKRKETKCT